MWALVYGTLAGAIVTCIMSYLIHSYRPCFDFNLARIRELFGFGKWILGSSILIFLLTQGDDILVGKLLGATALGFYQIAYRISNLPATEITHVISRITFPAYSKLQDSVEKLRRAYSNVLQVTIFLSFLLAGLIFALAPEFTSIFLGQKWLPMVPAMQVMVIYGAIRSFGATTGPLFKGVGSPDILTKLTFVQLILLAIIIYPLTIKFGIFGTALSIVIPNLITQIIAGIKVMKIIQSDKSEFLKSLSFPLISAITMILLIFSIKGWIYGDVVKFLAITIIGIASYLGFIYFLSKISDYDGMKITFQTIKQVAK